MMNWLQKLLYKWSGHKEMRKPLDVPTALQAMLEKGISIGKKDAQPLIVEKRVCRKHEMVLLIEIEIGRYICPMCEEDRHTDRLPAQVYTQARRGGAGPRTAALAAAPKTIDLSKLKGEQHEQGNN
jgi:dihydropteroate synthase